MPFDALEFDPLVASGDVLYDLAFLLMDLVERKLQPAANVVLNRYLAEAGRADDLDALAALPLLMSMRAAIRAKVTAARISFAPDADRAPIAMAAAAYFELAAALIAPPPPVLVAIGGLSGTGKSMLARALAPDLMPAPGAVLLRSDIERKAWFGVAETERLPAEAYTAEITARTYAALADKARRVTSAGHSAVIDAVFAAPAERAAMAAVAAATDVAFRGLFLTADLATRMARSRPSRRRRVRCGRGGCRTAGELCARPHGLEHDRCVRDAGADAVAGEGRHVPGDSSQDEAIGMTNPRRYCRVPLSFGRADGASSSIKARQAAPSRSSYWPVCSAHRKAPSPSRPSPSAIGTR